MTQIEMFPIVTSSQPDTPASRSVLPVSAAERKILATSGRTSYALLHPKDPLGAFSRMFMVTSHWASTKCCLTWKPKVTPQGRLLFQLAVSMRPTEETGSGSSPRKFAPTPTASDHIERKSTSTEKMNPLTGKSVSLDRFVKFWPTAEVQQSGQPEMWPTPTTQDNPQVRGQGATIGTNRGTTLGGAVRMWPTPKARDWKDGTSEGTKGRQSPDLGKVVGQSKNSGSLNPEWVEWLMGYPEGWTDLKD